MHLKWEKDQISLWGSSVSARANQPPGFSVRGTSTPDGLFQTIKSTEKISELLQTAALTILNFLLTIKVSYFLFFMYVKKFAIYHDIKGEFTPH